MNGKVPDDGTHFALMDKVYRRQRHFYDFTRRYYLLGRDRLIRELGVKPGERVLEVGCGTARNLIRISRAYRGEMYGLDASREMLQSARAAIVRARLESRIRLACGLAEDVSPAQFGLSERFDHIIFSYSLSMIPDWRGALRAAHDSLAAGGRVHIVDFGDLKGLYPLISKGLRAWLRLFHVTPRGELLARIEIVGGGAGSKRPHLLTGRYAFLWHATREELQRLAQCPVA